MTFHVINCNKTFQREQANKVLQHLSHRKCRMNTLFEQLYFVILRGVANWKRSEVLIHSGFDLAISRLRILRPFHLAKEA